MFWDRMKDSMPIPVINGIFCKPRFSPNNDLFYYLFHKHWRRKEYTALMSKQERCFQTLKHFGSFSDVFSFYGVGLFSFLLPYQFANVFLAM